MAVEGNTGIVLHLSLSDTNTIITALNSKVTEIVGVINSVQQQAAAQVNVAPPSGGNPPPPGDGQPT